MIIDTLTAAAKNALYPPVIRNALQAVIAQDPLSLPTGKYTVDGDNLFFTVAEGETRPLAEQRPEYHRQYIDIHIVLVGEEIIGAGNKGLTITPDGPFNAAHDIGFCEHISSESLIHLHPLELAILFPGELHRPMSALDAGARLRKIVVKINNDLL
ncbi:YhcH/YjgK/YiaL family protein [Enterobacter soli]|uniref:YhcH/YjgK/YiaL family protein n=1 Tax=Enterobacter soli TaxID=885040 RepID=UPI001C259549|nr:YhcH/YjgK/YiaL family protein [Enterobacter soli]HED3855557.1 YhcH/YjgK/YiaL family protein [Enterobacter soli]